MITEYSQLFHGLRRVVISTFSVKILGVTEIVLQICVLHHHFEDSAITVIITWMWMILDV